MKKIFLIFIASMFSIGAWADPVDVAGVDYADAEYPDEFQTMDEILYSDPDETPCATALFADALAENASIVNEDDDEEVIEQWIHDTFAQADVLSAVLDCPEFLTAEDDDFIRLEPVEYTFPGGRHIVVNYQTQPLLLKQRLTISSKRDVNQLNNISPRIGDPNDAGIWTNTDPAWYAIMVVQHGGLDQFVGPDKNNTVSTKYIEDHINELYPRGATCTNKSALANNTFMINRAVHETVGPIEGDKNDYYVAGDVSLHWITYLEIAVNVVIDVVTMGSGEIINGVAKSLRIPRIMNTLRRDALLLVRKFPAVQKYAQMGGKLKKLDQTMDRLREYLKLKKEISTLDKTRDAAKIADKTKDLNKLERELQTVDKLGKASPAQAKRLTEIQKREAEIIKAQRSNPGAREAREMRQELTRIRQERNQIRNNIKSQTNYDEILKNMEKESSTISKNMDDAAKVDPNVAKYAEVDKSYAEIEKLAKTLKGFKTAKAGNVVTRAWKASRTLAKSTKTLNRTEKIARSSMKSGRIRDWLFHSTMKNAAALGRLETKLGLLHMAVTVIGDMYDWTETSTGEYSNGVKFKPLLLLSADDIKGQENVVNYGMWLLWSGDSIAPEDDDAAYMQAMDFAHKFYLDLVDTMDEHNNHSCNVDIYVVRPVLRNPDIDPEMFFLIMNDEPWSTVTSTTDHD